MSAEKPCRLLDVTRLVERAGAGPLSGIDRVERAYLIRLAADETSFLLLCRTALGYLVLGPDIAPILLGWIEDPQTIPKPSLIGRSLAHARHTPGIEAALRPLARARLAPKALAGWLTANLAPGARYFNLGHANLTEPGLAHLRQVPGLRIVVMIHDTIPLDHPQFSANRTPAEFRAKLAAACRYADALLCPTAVVADDLRRWGQMFATSPTPIVAPLGVELAAPIPAEVPATLDLGGPYFVALGTIEPRKDHGLLLDIWADFHTSLPAAEIPRLLIIGRRGWKSEAVFSRLDNQGFTGQKVIELGDLSDGAVAAVLTRATALLAPSRAEGFGLPAAEAAARGVPVLACDLAVTREVLGHYPTYLPAANKTAWASKIKAMTQHAQTSTPRIPLSGVPDWTAHFNIVFNQF